MMKIICLKDQNDKLNPFEPYIWQEYRKKYRMKHFHIFFSQNWNFSIFQTFAFLTVKSKVIEIHKCAIPKKNHWNHLNLICFCYLSFWVLEVGLIWLFLSRIFYASPSTNQLTPAAWTEQHVQSCFLFEIAFKFLKAVNFYRNSHHIPLW